MPKLEALDRDGLGATSRRSRNTPESTPQRSRVEIPAAGKRDVRISAPPPSILAAFDQARRSATIPFGPPEQRGASKLPSTSDLLDVPHSHHVADRICAEIDDLLNEKINRDPDDKSVMDALRRTKFELPEAYTGKPNLEVFLKWVNDFVSWASNSNLVGPQFDRRPIDVLGSNLREAAADWFYTEVSSGSRSKRDWTFRSVLFGLYDRFIPRTARAQAIDDFNRCNYSSDRGIVDFWSRLRVMASRMPVYPDSYTLARRFLSGLPMNILEYITVTRGLSAEDSSIEELLRAARDVESSLQMLRLHNPNAPKPQALSESSSDGTSPLSVVPTSDIPELSQHDQNRHAYLDCARITGRTTQARSHKGTMLCLWHLWSYFV
ncbi:hypothetical protein DL93DRAFT_2096228 [Clavulina sp. PMI_390]|nr:hypothetical protein DL93DRAFT_2096228 [Clavulina sp. PMI_390]